MVEVGQEFCGRMPDFVEPLKVYDVVCSEPVTGTSVKVIANYDISASAQGGVLHFSDIVVNYSYQRIEVASVDDCR